MKHFALYDVDLTLFGSVPDPNTQTTTSADLAPENKTFWDRALIVLTGPELVHDQFAQQRDIPAGGGKTIEFRQFDPLPEISTPLVEGVTPDGQSLSVSASTATVSQYGGYVTTSDVLDMTALDPVVNEATKLIARQAGETLDTITRDVINAGTNVMYALGKTSGVPNAAPPASRSAVAYVDADTNHNLTVEDIKRAVRTLKRQNAPKIRGDYVAIIHPDVAFDLMRDPEWLAPKQYVDTQDLYAGEIGKLYGVRFVENTRAKTFTVGTGSSAKTVYSTLIIGDDAYGTTKVAGGGLQHIVKPLGSGGTSDPLDQRSTVGWKATKAAKILVQQYMVRIESSATP